METNTDPQPPADSSVDHAEPTGARRGGRIRLAALLAALAAAVAAFGAFVLPRAATDAPLASEPAADPPYAVVVEYTVLDRGGCDGDDASLTENPGQQT